MVLPRVNSDETGHVLADAVAIQAQMEIPAWCAVEGIDEPVFKAFLGAVASKALRQELKQTPESVATMSLVGMGFAIGWQAHKLSLAIPGEAESPPDLSESLE